eukprot:m.152368 g.152368  ORF g.152368 m.152368 type:complete len:85 (-) comp52849_c0_seq14:1877-2131(-)
MCFGYPQQDRRVDCLRIRGSIGKQVVTIEPGLYFPPNDDSVPKGLRGVGFRIEDDVVVRPSGVEVLTSAVPKGRKALEQLLAGN